MPRKMPCAVCGNLSSNYLFKDKALGIPICSNKCEHDYIENLSPDARGHAKLVQYLDDRIRENKKRNKIGWICSGVGVLLLFLAFLIPDVSVFITGNVLAIPSALATRHYEDKIRKLSTERKRLAI